MSVTKGYKGCTYLFVLSGEGGGEGEEGTFCALEFLSFQIYPIRKSGKVLVRRIEFVFRSLVRNDTFEYCWAYVQGLKEKGGEEGEGRGKGKLETRLFFFD